MKSAYRSVNVPPAEDTPRPADDVAVLPCDPACRGGGILLECCRACAKSIKPIPAQQEAYQSAALASLFFIGPAASKQILLGLEVFRQGKDGSFPISKVSRVGDAQVRQDIGYWSSLDTSLVKDAVLKRRL